MTDLKPEDLVKLSARLRHTAAGFPREMHGVVSAMHVPTGFSDPMLEAADALDSLLADRARMEKALREAEEVLAVAALMPMVDPVHGDEVEALGIRIGFGALMSSAQASWRKRADIKGGEFVAGPCFATVVATLKTIRQALGASQ